MSTTASRTVLKPLAILLSLLIAIAGLSAPAPSASAAESATASFLTWGFKSSWRGYISGFGGSRTVSGGAGASPEYTWPAGAATLDPGTGAGSATFGGSVRWVLAAHGIDVTLSDPRVVLAGDGTGQLYWTAAGSELLGGTLSSVVVGDPTSSGGLDTRAVSAAVAITAEGGAAFGGSYPAGTMLDPLAFTLSVPSSPSAAPTTTTVSASPEATAETGDEVILTAAVSPAASGTIQFRDGSTTLGDAFVVSAGVATLTTTWLASGEHSITAEFTSTDAAFGSSTSAALWYAITAPSSGGGGSVTDPEPVVTVSPTEGLETGDVVTVRGEHFGPDADTGAPLGTRPPLAGTYGGVYVTFGTFLDTWKPSAGAPSSARKAAPGATRWVVGADDVATVGGASRGAVPIEPDGSFEVEIVVTEGFEGALEDGNYGIYTYPGSGAIAAEFETSTPIQFAVPTVPTAPSVDPDATPAPGSLLWGVKSSFRDYVVGPIAKGTVGVTGGASFSGGAYLFPQSSAAGDGSRVTYRGAVTFTGHAGALNLRLSDPEVRVTNATTAVLSVVAGRARVDFATLDLGAARATTDAAGTRGYAGAPATLTSAGAARFEGFYAPGIALDPVTFTIGSPNGATGAPATVGTLATVHRPAPTPPATEGIESLTTGRVVEGQPVSFRVTGFQPHETGILVVVYSSPTVLATDATADAAGVVTWAGTLPVGLIGEHTLTFQGSVDRGIVLQIEGAEVAGCLVGAASLDWGFKESFRSYIDGSIANGEWTVSEGVTYETPRFTWARGSGGYDGETGATDLSFPGAVRFTGHGGVLDTTIANPRVVIDGDESVLVLDVTGTTQDGEVVAVSGVEFAELDLDAATRADRGGRVVFTGIPAVLTEAGAAAFGTYEEGSGLDPVDLSILADPACAQPAAADAGADLAVERVARSSPAWWIAIAAAIALLVVFAIVAAFVVRRARRA